MLTLKPRLISYAREDLPFADAMRAALDREGYFFCHTTDTSPVIIGRQITYLENCIFQNDGPPDQPGVIQLGKGEPKIAIEQ